MEAEAGGDHGGVQSGLGTSFICDPEKWNILGPTKSDNI